MTTKVFVRPTPCERNNGYTRYTCIHTQSIRRMVRYLQMHLPHAQSQHRTYFYNCAFFRYVYYTVYTHTNTHSGCSTIVFLSIVGNVFATRSLYRVLLIVLGLIIFVSSHMGVGNTFIVVALSKYLQ